MNPDAGGSDVPSDTHVDVVGMDALLDGVTTDAPPADGAAMCTAASDCDDGVFCNGAERCMPGATGADARGCLPGAAPCPADQACDEAMHACGMASCASPDADGDGHRAIACGGDDCDDTDPHRFPGNTEVCAVAGGDGGVLTRVDPGHDEDCDPTTYANAATHDGDHDGDGFVDHVCCNTDRSGGAHCGDDCADLAHVMSGAPFDADAPPNSVHPMQTEACNGIDDNCNGAIDDGLASVPWYPDCDGDGYGTSAPGAGMPGCGAEAFGLCNGHARVRDNTDCDDTRADVHPGAMEQCTTPDGGSPADENCNGMVNERCGSCSAGDSQTCGQVGMGCAVGTRVCSSSGTWGSCSVNQSLINCYTDADSDGFSPSATPQLQACVCPTGTSSRAPTMLDCNDSNPAVHPTAAEMPGDGVDENCDGQELCFLDRDMDGHRAMGTTTVLTADIACQTSMGHAQVGPAANDCCDTDANAYPGAMGWFTVADACGSFDYDCSGTAELQHSTMTVNHCDCRGSVVPCEGTPTPGWCNATIPGCGMSNDWCDRCTMLAGTGVCGPVTCRPSRGSTQTQGCH